MRAGMQQAGEGKETRALSAREAPNPKLQAPKKFQTPITKRGAPAAVRFRNLELGICLELGIWSLELPAQAGDLGFGIWDFRRS
jgi:hypothetical protein